MSASVPTLLSDHTVPEPRGPTVRPQAQNSIAHAQPAAHLADEEPGGRGGDDAGEEPKSPGDAHEEAGVPAERMARARRKPPAHRQRSGRPFLGRRDGFPATQLGVGRVSLAPRHLGPHRPVPALTPPVQNQKQNQNQGATLSPGSAGARLAVCGVDRTTGSAQNAWVQIWLCLGLASGTSPDLLCPKRAYLVAP